MTRINSKGKLRDKKMRNQRDFAFKSKEQTYFLARGGTNINPKSQGCSIQVF